MKNHKSSGFGVLPTIIILAVLAGGVYLYTKSSSSLQPTAPVTTPDNSSKTPISPATGEWVMSEVPELGSNQTDSSCGLVVDSTYNNSSVSFPLTIRGRISNNTTPNCSWRMFEGQAGSAQLYFNYNNEGWKRLGLLVPIQVDDWTNDNTAFHVTVNFNNDGIGLSRGTPLKVSMTEEDPSGKGLSKTKDLFFFLK